MTNKKDNVFVQCYGKLQLYNNRGNALAFFLTCMRCSEGSERDRYTNIYLGLLNNENYIKDYDDEYVSESDIDFDLLSVEEREIIKKEFNLSEDKLKDLKDKHNEKLETKSKAVEKAKFKNIAEKIIETHSAHNMVEDNGTVYVSHYGVYEFKTPTEFLQAIKDGELVEDEDYNQWSSYEEMIKDYWINDIKDDFNDIGLTDIHGNWDFYLTKEELLKIGFSENEINFELALEKDALKQTYTVHINEVVHKSINTEIRATSQEEAERIASENYENGLYEGDFDKIDNELYEVEVWSEEKEKENELV